MTVTFFPISSCLQPAVTVGGVLAIIISGTGPKLEFLQEEETTIQKKTVNVVHWPALKEHQSVFTQTKGCLMYIHRFNVLAKLPHYKYLIKTYDCTDHRMPDSHSFITFNEHKEKAEYRAFLIKKREL